PGSQPHRKVPGRLSQVAWGPQASGHSSTATQSSPDASKPALHTQAKEPPWARQKALPPQAVAPVAPTTAPPARARTGHGGSPRNRSVTAPANHRVARGGEVSDRVTSPRSASQSARRAPRGVNRRASPRRVARPPSITHRSSV